VTAAARRIILLAAFGGLLFDGMELGLMPIAPLSVTKSLRGGRFTDALAGDLSFPKTHPALIGACPVCCCSGYFWRRELLSSGCSATGGTGDDPTGHRRRENIKA
jgi:hypothetical protein